MEGDGSRFRKSNESVGFSAASAARAALASFGSPLFDAPDFRRNADASEPVTTNGLLKLLKEICAKQVRNDMWEKLFLVETELEKRGIRCSEGQIEDLSKMIVHSLGQGDPGFDGMTAGLFLSSLINGSESSEFIVYGSHSSEYPVLGKSWDQADGNLIEYLGFENSKHIKIRGDVGVCLGNRMRRGVIRLIGNAGTYAGFMMEDGEISIGGMAGDHIGTNMTGGKIIVGGDIEDIRVGGLFSGELRFEGSVKSLEFSFSRSWKEGIEQKLGREMDARVFLSGNEVFPEILG